MGNRWEDYEGAAKHGPLAIAWKAGIVLFAFVVVMAIVGTVFHWCGEGAQVARDEFGPKAMLAKYEWFKEQAAAIKKMDKDVALFESRVSSLDEQYKSYGSDHAKWPLDVRIQYNHAREMGRDDWTAVVSQRNNLVREYNAAGSKFNWKPFATDPNCPSSVFQEYKTQ